MSVPKFHSYPKEWGMQLHYTGKMPTSIDMRDLDLLDELKKRFEKRQGDVLSWKFDLKPLTKELPGILAVLDRLWKVGIIVKFAQQFYTKHEQKPEYIYWYIWEEVDEPVIERDNSRTAHYIV